MNESNSLTETSTSITTDTNTTTTTTGTATTTATIPLWTEKEINFLKKAIHLLHGKAERVALYFKPPKTKEEVLLKLQELQIDVKSLSNFRKHDRGTHALIFNNYFPPQEFYRATLKKSKFGSTAVHEATELFSSLNSPDHLSQMSSLVSSHVRETVLRNAPLESHKFYDFIACLYECNEDVIQRKYETLSLHDQSQLRECLTVLTKLACSPEFQDIRNRIQRQCQALHRFVLPSMFQTSLDPTLSSSWILTTEKPTYRKLFNPLPIRTKMREQSQRLLYQALNLTES